MNSTIGNRRRSNAGLLVGAMILTLSFPLGSSALAQDTDVVGRVNGQDITADDLALAEQMYGPQLAQMPPDARRSILVDALIDMKIVSAAARAANVTGQDAYKRQLAFLEDQTLRTLFLEQQVEEAVTDSVVRATYDEQAARIPPVTERRLRHILLGSEGDAVEVIEALKGERRSWSWRRSARPTKSPGSRAETSALWRKARSCRRSMRRPRLYSLVNTRRRRLQAPSDFMSFCSRKPEIVLPRPSNPWRRRYDKL